MLAAQGEQVGIVTHPVQAIVICHLVLVEEDIVRTVERLGNHKVAIAIVERRDAECGKNDRCRSLLFDGRQGLHFVEGTEDTTDVDERSGVVGVLLIAGQVELSGRMRGCGYGLLQLAGAHPCVDAGAGCLWIGVVRRRLRVTRDATVGRSWASVTRKISCAELRGCALPGVGTEVRIQTRVGASASGMFWR